MFLPGRSGVRGVGAPTTPASAHGAPGLAIGARVVAQPVVLAGQDLRAAIYLTRNGQLPDRDWIIAQLRQCEASPVELLAGRPAKPAPAASPMEVSPLDASMPNILVHATRSAGGRGATAAQGSCGPSFALTDTGSALAA